ncbi:MAG: GHKL domain-containing protein [Bacteroidetes bacterium]|nr:GHKL domain-containing protein [Bacteroidota bacterium]
MVFINLMKNSMEVLENTEEPQIRIRISKYEEKKTLIEVKDNGAGMSEEIMSQIFIPFYTTKPKGSGIGLSLSNQIIRLHGGSIAVDSKPGKGSTFTIVI